MKMSRRVTAATIGLALAATVLAGCSAQTSDASSSPASSRNAGEAIKGTRLCYMSNGPSGMQVRGSSFLNDIFSWKGWDSVASGTEYCLQDFVSTSVKIDRYGNGVEKMSADIKNEVRFGDGSKVSFFGDNPLIGYPMVGWSAATNETGWSFEELSVGETTTASVGNRSFDVERRSDAALHKEFIITFTS
jgi:hypothetical protein